MPHTPPAGSLPPLFNPSNDLALAANTANYIPPRLVQAMEQDLQPVTRFWDHGPWGWSLNTRRRYLDMGIAPEQLPSDSWLERHRQLSSRTTDAAYIQALLREDWGSHLVGHHMQTVDLAGFESMQSRRETSVGLIYKAPWSSSGKGNLPAANGLLPDDARRVRNILGHDGFILVDRFYPDKVVDFSMEFDIQPDGESRFLGYSMFLTAERGRYGGQKVASQEQLLQWIGADRGLLGELVSYHLLHLPRLGYTGPMGIDMMRLSDGHLHPVVELNLRRNMGILAIEVERRHPGIRNLELTPRGNHGFQMVIEEGLLKIINLNVGN